MTRSASMLQTWQQGLRRLIQGQAPGARAYRAFDLVLARRIHLSPSFARLVFTGPDVALMHTLAPDQRVKLLFPAPDGSLPTLPHDVHWKTAHSALPAEQRPPMRTYTIRALRPDALEVDVDFVLHGVNGPASAWATHAQEGDRLLMVAPNLAHAGDPGGYEWKPPQGTRHVLLIGDETALPAIAGILEALAEQQPEVAVEAFIEVPHEADCLPLRHSANTRLHWLPRELLRCEHGQAMQHAVHELASLPLESAFYAWVAGESATVLNIRRHLTKQRGLPRDRLMTMGYWRLGEACD